MFFDDRYDAGARLAQIVKEKMPDGHDWDIVGIARGGVIIAGEIAKIFGAKAKAICVEDLHTKQNILAISSLGSGMVFGKKSPGDIVFVPNAEKSQVTGAQKLFQRTREKQIRFAGPVTEYGPKVLLCDDGVVSGITLVTAVRCLKHYGVKEVAVAIPVVLPWVEQQGFSVFTWRVTKMSNPATGIFYKRFEDTEDEEVIQILR